MKHAVLILSEDAVFARMLELELQMRRISTLAYAEFSEGAEASVILVDLDTSVIPDVGEGTKIVGFTRSDTVSVADPDRRCSMILHRPFEVTRMVEEVEGLIQGFPAERSRSHALSLSGETLSFGEAYVLLSPKETLVMELLLSRPSAVLRKEEIASRIGVSLANKTEVYVCMLRKKLECLTRTVTIRTVRGIGYCLEVIETL